MSEMRRPLRNAVVHLLHSKPVEDNQSRVHNIVLHLFREGSSDYVEKFRRHHDVESIRGGVQDMLLNNRAHIVGDLGLRRQLRADQIISSRTAFHPWHHHAGGEISR